MFDWNRPINVFAKIFLVLIEILKRNYFNYKMVSIDTNTNSSVAILIIAIIIILPIYPGERLRSASLRITL